MDKRLERTNAEKVRRRLARSLQPLGFSRTKTSFFTRPKSFWIEFVHLHKYSFAPGFRVHLGIRVLNDNFEAVALNGPDSHSLGWFNLDYDTTPKSIDKCAEKITRFCQDVGESWFQEWNEPAKLYTAPNSPLEASAKVALRRAVNANSEWERVRYSYQLLGIGSTDV
jgi:hypothetical protein